MQIPTPDNRICQGDGGRAADFSSQYRALAEQRQCAFLDAATVVLPSPIDGVHLDASEHRKLGAAVAQSVLELI